MVSNNFCGVITSPACLFSFSVTTFSFRWMPACRSQRRSWKAASFSTWGQRRGPGTWWLSPKKTWTAGCPPSACSVASTPPMTVRRREGGDQNIPGTFLGLRLKWRDVCGLWLSQCENWWEERKERTCREKDGQKCPQDCVLSCECGKII